MADQLPPARYRIVERDGRLEVIDKATGKRPATAAQLMGVHDRAEGFDNERRDQSADRAAERSDKQTRAGRQTGNSPPVARVARPTQTSAANPASAKAAGGEGATRSPADAAPSPSPSPSPSPKSAAASSGQRPADMPSRPAPQSGMSGRAAPNATSAPSLGGPGQAQSRTITTAKWWDAKGPRNIVLTPAGQQYVRGRVTNWLMILIVGVIVAVNIQPFLLLTLGFLFTRFGGTVIADVGAGWIDAAVKVR